MANEIIKRDQNSVTVAAGVTTDAQEIGMLRVDPITDRVLAHLTIDSDPTSAMGEEIASRDQNRRTVVMGWNEEDNVLQEILTDNDGYLLCDVEFV